MVKLTACQTPEIPCQVHDLNYCTAQGRVRGRSDMGFMVGASVLVFYERIAARELAGVAFVTAGILALVPLTA
jgi:hypothetical protein